MHAASHWKTAAATRHAPVWIGMAAVATMSWVYLVRMEESMSMMGNNGMAQAATGMEGGGIGLLGATFAMWAVMMLAMMLPAIMPSALLFSNLASKRNPDNSNRATAMYVAGYAACWILFAAPAAALQSTLVATWLLDPMGQSTSGLLSAAILFAAGLYQFTPLKTACLSKCRTPLAFFLAKWRDGTGRALVLGIQHGGYCVGCCWALMAVMFVVGAMNLAWMGALTVLVLSEKVVPPAWRIDRITGVTLIVSGLWMGTRLVG